MRIRFITSTPLDIRRGSGTYVGIRVLAEALRRLGHDVEIESSRVRLPVYTLERLLFNRGLRRADGFDLTVGFDMDGYRIAGGNPTHIASLKGVVADETHFERGLTRISMGAQAHYERLHAQRAARVITTSRYSAEHAAEFYSLHELPAVVPEPIELGAWRELLDRNPARSVRFTALYVGRLYRRKRVDVLLRAAARLHQTIPELEVRIVGVGPHMGYLLHLWRALKLDGVVTWLGDVSRAELAAEYNRADVFCLPSVQEGFGIVLLEAMAAGKAIAGSRAASIPEVAPHAELVEPDSPEALAAAIRNLYASPDRLAAIGAAGRELVWRYDSDSVATEFLRACMERIC